MKIIFISQNIVYEGTAGETILEASAKAGVVIDGNCSGKGTCGKCKVYIKGVDTEVTEEEKKLISDEELKQGVRLACCHKISEEMIVETLDYESTAARKNKIISLPEYFTPDKGKKKGIAVDIGTTTVVVMLWDLETGTMMDIKSFANPQGSFGADVISRISYTMTDDNGLQHLHDLTIKGINEAVKEFIELDGITADDIEEYSIAGNTTMSHLFLNINPASLAVAPFKPQFEGRVTLSATELKLIGSETCRVNVLSNIAGHVGSDITAGIITTDIMEGKRNHLFLDVGTNGEIVLTAKGRVLTCSTAAGPAFEGSSIKYGMRAATGAIEKVSISEEEGLTIKTIGDKEPVGICGSGIIDSVGELIKCGVVDKKGRLLSKEKLQSKGASENILKYLDEEDGAPCFVLYENSDNGRRVTITQKDVREVQLAKAAISAGIYTLMHEAGIEKEDLDCISIAGAFGSYIDIKSAVLIGLLPCIDFEKIKSIGNAAGIGVAMALLSGEYKRKSDKAASEIEHIELAERSDFQEIYMKSMFF